MSNEGFENFSVYKFSIDYPAVCRVEFNPKSRREKGDVVFHFPDREKVFLSWGALEAAQKKFQTVEAQAEHSIKTVKKSQNVKNLERVKQDTMEVNSHKAAYNRMKLDEMPAGFFPGKRVTKHEAHSLHLHCENMSRYFVIYTMLSPNAPADFEELFLKMIGSFKCH